MMFYKGWDIEYKYSEGTIINPYWKLSKGFQVIWLNGVMSLDDVKNFIDEMLYPKHVGVGCGVDKNLVYIVTATDGIGKVPRFSKGASRSSHLHLCGGDGGDNE